MKDFIIPREVKCRGSIVNWYVAAIELDPHTEISSVDSQKFASTQRAHCLVISRQSGTSDTDESKLVVKDLECGGRKTS